MSGINTNTVRLKNGVLSLKTLSKSTLDRVVTSTFVIAVANISTKVFTTVFTYLSWTADNTYITCDRTDISCDHE